MRVALTTMGLDPTTATAQDLREAYSRVKPLLRLKPHVVRGQHRQAIEDAAQAIEDKAKRTAAFDEEDAYTLPWDVLRARANDSLGR
jgi:hypothetical protein